MLKGYRNNVKKPHVVKQALSVYDSISAANSAVTPTTIHTNAVLSVCARAHDIDAIWNIAGRLPERGPGAPDHITFTTILQALSIEAQKRAIERGAREGPGFNPESIFEQVVNDARRLWLDITSRWRRGNLHLDEALVCAMGRLLMLSNDKETQQDVLNMVQQTMKIGKVSDFPESSQPVKIEDTNMWEDVVDEQPPTSFDNERGMALQQADTTKGSNEVDPSLYATPGQNTLSMLIETATALRQLKLGKYYWDLLTAEEGRYQIVPDHQNVMAYLRLLRVSRASRAILDLLREPRTEEVKHKLMVRGTFIIAMSTCLRDKKNPNVFETASRILDLMQDSTQESDLAKDEEEELGGHRLRFSPKVLRMYLEVAVATTKGLNGEHLEKTKNGDLDFERDPNKNHTLRALRRLGPDAVNVRQLIKLHLIDLEQQASMEERTTRVKNILTKRKITPYSMTENIEELIELLRTMIGAIDKILQINEKLEDEGMGPLAKDILAECWTQKRKLSAFVTKYAHATVDSKSLSDHRARRVDERGQRLRSKYVANDHHKAEEGNVVNSVPEEEFDADMPPPNPRAKALNDIKTAQERVMRKFDERGLSRKQKIELLKREKIRAQFPVSKLREPEVPEKKQASMAARLKHRRMQILEDKPPVWRERQMEVMRKVAGKRDKKIREKIERRERREELERNERARAKQKETYKGWGGAFEELAREQGRGVAGGFVELKP